MDTVQTSQGLDLLFRKLGHELAEIRSRALQSITSKLEHGLLHEADLVQERQLFIRLLEWFNFDPSPMQDEVFKLLLNLSKHTSACEVLVSLGGTKFLTELRPDLESGLKPQLDTLLDRLFHVTDSALSDQSRCTYQRTTEYPVQEQKTNPEGDGKQTPQYTSGYFIPDNEGQEIIYSTQPTARNELPAHSEDNISYSRFPGFPWQFLTATDRHVLASTSSSLCSTNAHLVQNACSFLLDVVFRDFPAEIFLQRPTILNTLLTLLGSRPNSNLMIATCECLSYISQNLLHRIFYYQDPALYCPRQGLPIHRSAVPEIHPGGLRSSIDTGRMRTDAEGGRQERHGGDGRDENSSSSLSSFASSMRESMNRNSIFTREDDSLEDDQTVALQLSQISALQFCISSLQTVVPLLRIDSIPLFLKVYQVAVNLVRLLDHVLDSEVLWNSTSTSAKTLHSEISSLLEGIGEAILYHYHLNSTERVFPRSPRGGVYNVADTPEWSLKYESKYDATYHRVAYHACSVLATDFLKSVLPVEKSGDQIKGTLSTALYVIACDEALAISFPNVCSVAETYLEQCSKENHDALVRLRRVVKSISYTHQFLDECSSKDKEMETSLELAQSSIECLPYYTINDLIPSIVQVISEACNEKLKTHDPSHCGTSRSILLRLLAHPLTRIRNATYKSCLEVAQNSLNVTDAAEDPSGKKSYACAFLMDGSILYEICLHGIGDSSVLVSTAAQDLILHLLQNKLLMEENLWNHFKEVLQPVMPVLQAFTGETELLRAAIFGLLANVSNDCQSLEKVQCLMRALLIKQRSVRSVAGGMMIQVLTSFRREVIEEIEESENSLSKLLERTSNIVGLTDLLVIDNPMSLACTDPSSRSTGPGLFHEDAVVRMLGIFRSRSIDWHVRRSALQQISVMLNDPKLHEIFLKSDGLSSIKSHLVELVRENSVLTETEKVEGDSCVTVIKTIAYWNADIRFSLYNDPETILSLLRMADLCRLSPLSLSQAAATLALLLFHDVLQEHSGDQITSDETPSKRELSLPAGIMTRYQIPFLCPSHHLVSVHRTLASPPSQCDPLTTGPTAFAIRIASCLAKHERDVAQTLEIQIELLKTPDTKKKKDSQSTTLTQEDIIAISYSFPISAISGFVESLSTASSHSAVRHVVTQLRIMLLCCPEEFSSTLFAGDKWQKALNKFLQVLPSSIEDEALLMDIVHLLQDVIKAFSSLTISMKSLSGESDEKVLDTLTWLLKLCIPEDSSTLTDRPLFFILKSSEPQREPFPNQSQVALSSVTVRRQLCKAILSMLSHVSRRLPFIKKKDLVHKFQALLCQVLLIRLKLADAPQFYDLPSMEVTLECLLHVTASCPGWTNAKVLEWQSGHRTTILPTDGTILCRQLTSTLLEVVSAFHIENRGSSMSYMGKGVSHSATQSIVHLIHEIVRNAKNKEQIQESLNLLQHVSTAPESSTDRSAQLGPKEGSYDWMLPLWSARDPRIRYSGIALATVLSQTVKGCTVLANSFQEYLGGLWSMAFGVFFDDSECSAVREQAATLLSNLLSHGFQAPESGRGSEVIWQGPVVKDQEHGTTMSGASALIALLHHLRLYWHLEVMISRYNSSPSIQPVTIMYAPFTASSSDSTSTQNSFLTGPDSTSGLDATPVTQQSISTIERSQSFSSAKDATPNVSTPASLDVAEHARKQEMSAMQQAHTSHSHYLGGRESAGSVASSLPSEWQALCTPKLIANTCNFLTNLITLAPHETINLLEPNGTIQHIAHLIDPPLLTSLLMQLKHQSSVENSGALDNYTACLKTAATSLISQYSETCCVLHAYAYNDRNMGLSLLSDEEIFDSVVNLLGITSPFEAWNEEISRMKENAMNFMSTAIQMNVSRVGDQVKKILSKDWPSFSKSLQELIRTEGNTDSLLSSSLTMLSNLLSCLAISSKQKKSSTSFCILFQHSTGEPDAVTICSTLVDIFESLVTKPDSESNSKLLSVCCNALQSLFAVSPASKETAVESGFLERLLAETKRLEARLELFMTNTIAALSRQKSKVKSSFNSTSPPKECEDIVRKIILLLHVMNNFIHGSFEIKVLASEAGLGQLLTKLWGWTTMYPKLMMSALKLSSTFTAGCEVACASLASSPVGQQPMTWHIITLTREMSSQVNISIHVQPSLLQALFSLLCNLSISHECRSVMWKSGFLNEFLTSADRGQHPKRSKQQSSLLVLWLKLLHCLSFHTDGQLNILKVSDVLEVLIEIHSSSKSNSDLVMSILRNLCFHNPSKHRISSNKTVVRHLMKELSFEAGDKLNPSAASAVWALLSNSQKSKVHLKGAGIGGVVQSTLAYLSQKRSVEQNSDFKNSLTAVLEIVQT